MLRYVVLVALFLYSVVSPVCAKENVIRPKNIIFLIGDGMGLSHISLCRNKFGKLNLERFKICGFSNTRSLNSEVTDSAAGGTALSTGQRTNNTMVSMLPGNKPIDNLLDYALKKNLRTGVVVTCLLPHATPADFTAHNSSRYNLEEIALEQSQSKALNIAIGGGLRYFRPTTAEQKGRKDNRNLIEEISFRKSVLFSYDELKSFTGNDFMAFLADEHLPNASTRKYTLGNLTEIAINNLKTSKNGFVLMVEGSQIDTESHSNKAYKMIYELKDFDTAVKVALDFAEKDKNTLVVVTADHETGGLTLPENKAPFKSRATIEFSTSHHTGSMVPVFAFGPGSEYFAGIQQNYEIGQKLINFIK